MHDYGEHKVTMPVTTKPRTKLRRLLPNRSASSRPIWGPQGSPAAEFRWRSLWISPSKFSCTRAVGGLSSAALPIALTFRGHARQAGTRPPSRNLAVGPVRARLRLGEIDVTVDCG